MKHLLTLISFGFLFVFTSCDKDDPVIPNEEELITTLNYTLTPTGGGSAVTLSFQDLDGDGGTNPTITGGTLAEGQSYEGVIELLNETESPAENITLEVRQEDAEHQFFYSANIANFTIEYSDQDADGNPVGINTLVTAGSNGSGTITITLRHEPNKSASGVSTGDISNAGGETDIQVTFPINVE